MGKQVEYYSKEFFGVKYPFAKCARPALLKRKECVDCSVNDLCEASEKIRQPSVQSGKE